jgi:UPF0716 protein FxsA
VVLVLLPIVVLAAEVLVFIEIGHAIGWPTATLLVVGISLLGVLLLRVHGRAAIGRVSLAVSERRMPGQAALDGALGLLGCMLLILPGFLTGVFGMLLLLPACRRLVRVLLVRHYAARLTGFVAMTGRFSARARGAPSAADVESTAIEDDLDQLGR